MRSRGKNARADDVVEELLSARDGAWLLAVLLGGVSEEVINHAVQQGGELVQLLRGPVRQGSLHAGGAGLADAVRCCPACGG